ncbi:MAG TPA: GNAT family N-acetyltransferase, partial [Burkholderiales bacterium]|nr:GNAT family N-acetyltransferase [Burkholderiales bacterium]
LVISLASEYDAEDIGEMSRVEIEQGLPWRWTPERVMRSIVNTNTNVAVVRKNDKLIAFGIMKYDDLVAHLLLLAVHTLHQRQGIGTSLLKWLEQVASTAGIERIQAEVLADNVGARFFYYAHKYKERSVVVGMYHGSKNGVTLEKSLIPG